MAARATYRGVGVDRDWLRPAHARRQAAADPLLVLQRGFVLKFS